MRLSTETASNPEIAAISQHQDPASDGAAAANKAITLALAVQSELVFYAHDTNSQFLIANGQSLQSGATLSSRSTLGRSRLVRLVTTPGKGIRVTMQTIPRDAFLPKTCLSK